VEDFQTNSLPPDITCISAFIFISLSEALMPSFAVAAKEKDKRMGKIIFFMSAI
jgi:hypothetical protein